MLAASRIAESAVVEPAAHVEGVEVVAVAARDLDRARQAARRWGIDRAIGSYDELIESPDVDAIYVATPASLHREWAIRSIEAGKHVLCEKPLAANADDARRIADAAAGADVVVMEAYHWRHHPMAAQIGDVIGSGVLGRLDRVEAAFDIPVGRIGRDDIRWDLSLGGGSTMDLGCYSIQWARFAAGADPQVVSATATCPVEGVDGALTAELRWPSGVTGTVRSSMIAEAADVVAFLRVVGERGTMLASNPLAPQHGASISVDVEGETTTHEVSDSVTYVHQLVAFRDAVTAGAGFATTAADGVRTMEIVDACYRAAGLDPRPAVD